MFSSIVMIAKILVRRSMARRICSDRTFGRRNIVAPFIQIQDESNKDKEIEMRHEMLLFKSTAELESLYPRLWKSSGQRMTRELSINVHPNVEEGN